MTVRVRVIPCLDVDAGRVVKGVNFVDLVDAGDPVEMARVYDAEGADAPVESIARACGVTRQVLYRQFDHRHDLDVAVADRIVSMLLDHVIVRMTTDDGVEAGLRGTIDAYLDFVLEHRPLYDFVRALPAAPGSGSPVDRITDVVVTVVA